MMRRGVVYTIALLSILILVGTAHATTFLLHDDWRNTAWDAAGLEDDCGDDPQTPYAWHFILNSLDDGTPAGQLWAEFTTDGTIGPVTAQKVVANGKTQHFYVYTSTKDYLIDARAEADSTVFSNLVLSHVCTPEQEIPEFPTEAIPVGIAALGYLAIRRFKGKE